MLFCCLLVLVCYMLQTYKNTGLSYKLPRPIAINPNFANLQELGRQLTTTTTNVHFSTPKTFKTGNNRVVDQVRQFNLLISDNWPIAMNCCVTRRRRTLVFANKFECWKRKFVVWNGIVNVSSTLMAAILNALNTSKTLVSWFICIWFTCINFLGYFIWS